MMALCCETVHCNNATIRILTHTPTNVRRFEEQCKIEAQLTINSASTIKHVESFKNMCVLMITLKLTAYNVDNAMLLVLDT